MTTKTSRATVVSSPVYGFTVIEMMVTVLILGILLSTGVPSLRQTIINNRLTAEANSFVAAMHYARSEALKRNAIVAVGMPGSNPGDTDWGNGWRVWVDTNNDNNNTGETDLRVAGAMSGGYTLVGTGPIIKFLPSGFVFNNATLNVTVCKQGSNGRNISVALTGQVQTAASAAVCS